ncbi:MAG TPA: 2-phospho-L-lactate guanylyltransferase [Streptosporangiaceae bacterium]|nr:2-phospho-L-lactate guanylyltransferase [Streptosporangiaceae bacterium]
MAPDDHPEAGHSSAGTPLLSWSVVIPVKVLAVAKSRLAGLTSAARSELALAMAADTIAAAVAAAAVGAVLVVTDDPAVTDIAAGLGALVLPDRPAAGLNEALEYGAAHSETIWPERGRAGLAGDLPAARPEELTAALAAAAGLGAAFVPDADGTGTVLYATAPGVEFRPQFGVGSRNRHRAAGAIEIGPLEVSTAGLRLRETGNAGNGAREAGPDNGDTATTPVALAGLRRDVDTVDDLRRAAELGVGERTRALLAAEARILGSSAVLRPETSDDSE